MNTKRLVTVSLALALAVPIFGQRVANAVAVEGKQHPELIPDATAYLHLFRALQPSPKESAEVFARRRQAIAKETGLDDAQISMLLAASDNFAQQSRALNEVLGPGTARYAARAKMTLQIVDQLQHALGAHGAYALTQYINVTVKPHVTLYQPK
jgi:hypothetical protein